MSDTISREAWLAELDQLAAAHADPDGMTVTEMVTESGRGRTWVLAVLRRAITCGAWECTGSKRVAAIDGSLRPAPCYRPKAGGKPTQ